MRKICRLQKMPGRQTVYAWLLRHPEFLEQYHRAMALSRFAHCDDVVDIADDASRDFKRTKAGKKSVTGHIAHTKILIDAHKWAAGGGFARGNGERSSPPIATSTSNIDEQIIRWAEDETEATPDPSQCT